MNRLVNIGLLALYIILSLSCKSKKNNTLQSPDNLSNSKIAKSISIHFAGEVDFRRSYADIQFMDNEKEIDKYLDAQRKSNPLLMGNDSGKLYEEFVRIGFAKKNELQLNKLITDPNNKALIQESSIMNENILIRRTFDDSIDVWKISAISGKDSPTIEFAYEFPELKYWLLDIIPSGNKEIVVLSQHYIMNGDNFDLLVYEIKTSN